MAGRVHPKHAAVVAARAREMRFALTPSEAALWAAIRGERLGVVFRRQVPIGRYIADFCAPAARLVVEVDGGCHERRGAADGRRDAVLGRLGYRVLRLPAELVLGNVRAAVGRVIAALETGR